MDGFKDKVGFVDSAGTAVEMLKDNFGLTTREASMLGRFVCLSVCLIYRCGLVEVYSSGLVDLALEH